MSFKLEIKEKDGSIYWTEHFHSQEAAEKWINEEKTRPYAKEDWSFDLIDISPPPKPQSEIDAENAALAERLALVQSIKAIKKKDLITIDACADAIDKIAKMFK